MKIFLNLVKAQFNETFNFSNQKSVNSKVQDALYFLYLGSTILGLFFVGISVSGLLVAGMNYVDIIGVSEGLQLIYIIGSVICSIIAQSRVKTIFNSKDYELVSSLPIKRKTIILSKICAIYVFLFIFSISLFIIPIIYYLNTSYYLYGLLSFMLIFLLPFTSTIFGLLISITSKSLGKLLKIEKLVPIFIVLLYIVVIYFGIVILMNQDLIYTIRFITYFYPISLLFSNLDIYRLIAIILVHVVIYYSFIYIINKHYIWCNDLYKKKYKSVTYNINKHKDKKLSQLLLLKELKLFKSIPSYIANTTVWTIICFIFTVLTVVLFFVIPEEIDFLIKEGQEALIIAPLSFTFGIAMVSTTSSSISLEGENFYLLKSLPLKVKDITYAKVKINMIFNGIPVTIMTFILSLVLKLGYMSIFVSLFTFVFSGIVSYLGVLINLLLPKIDATSPTKVVKNSLAVIVNLLVGMILYFVFFTVIIILYILKLDLLSIASGVVLSVLFSVLTILLHNKNCDKLFKKIT